MALLDCTVKVFFLDSLKFFLSLYGHKLPVNLFTSFRWLSRVGRLICCSVQLRWR